jgi:hypothetical protein
LKGSAIHGFERTAGLALRIDAHIFHPVVTGTSQSRLQRNRSWVSTPPENGFRTFITFKSVLQQRMLRVRQPGSADFASERRWDQQYKRQESEVREVHFHYFANLRI